jgi:hypothetical protein
MRHDVYGVPYPSVSVLEEQGIVVERRFADSYWVRETTSRPGFRPVFR